MGSKRLIGILYLVNLRVGVGAIFQIYARQSMVGEQDKYAAVVQLIHNQGYIVEEEGVRYVQEALRLSDNDVAKGFNLFSERYNLGKMPRNILTAIQEAPLPHQITANDRKDVEPSSTNEDSHITSSIGIVDADDFPSIGYAGLVNIGNSCWLNVVLQSLFKNVGIHMFKVLASLENDLVTKRNLKHGHFLLSLLELMRWYRDQSNLKDYVRKDTLQVFYNSFLALRLGGAELVTQQFGQADASECRTIVVDDIRNSFASLFDSQEHEIIPSSLFTGKFKHTISCSRCGYTREIFEPFEQLDLEIPEQSSNNFHVPLGDCFSSFGRSEDVPELECGNEQCKCKGHCSKVHIIWSLPEVLVIVMKRYNQFGIKRRDPVVFPLNKFHCPGNNEVSKHSYNLESVIEHLGDADNVALGHYISYSRRNSSNIASNWVKYNDGYVKKIKCNQAEFDHRNVYILFYRRQPEDSNLSLTESTSTEEKLTTTLQSQAENHYESRDDKITHNSLSQRSSHVRADDSVSEYHDALADVSDVVSFIDIIDDVICCGRCQRVLKEDSRFCDFCGHHVSPANMPFPQDVEPVTPPQRDRSESTVIEMGKFLFERLSFQSDSSFMTAISQSMSINSIRDSVSEYHDAAVASSFSDNLTAVNERSAMRPDTSQNIDNSNLCSCCGHSVRDCAKFCEVCGLQLSPANSQVANTSSYKPSTSYSVSSVEGKKFGSGPIQLLLKRGANIASRGSASINTEFTMNSDGAVSIRPGKHKKKKFRRDVEVTVSKYFLERTLGEGAFGLVYRARLADGSLDDKYAIKALKNMKRSHQTVAQKEAKLLADPNLKHVNIVRYIDAFFHNDVFYIAFEFANAGDLAYQIEMQKGPKPKPKWRNFIIKHCFVQIVTGLHYLHSHRSKNIPGGILHRDLKPANILVCKSPGSSTLTFKIADFGLAKVMEGSQIQVSSFAGTRVYMSPEALNDAQKYSFPSDVWALGCILYELCTLERAFRSEGAVWSVIKAEESKVSESIPTISKSSDSDWEYWRELSDICAALLVRDSSRRFSCSELLSQLTKNQNVDSIPTNVESRRKLDPASDFGSAREIKILAIANSPVGRTSLIARWAEDIFPPKLDGADVSFLDVLIFGRTYTLRFENMPESLRYQTDMCRSYFKGVDILLLCYDITNPQSFDEGRAFYSWLVQFLTESDTGLSEFGTKTTVALIGLKLDLADDREGKVPVLEGSPWPGTQRKFLNASRARDMLFDNQVRFTGDVLFFEVSAKTGKNCKTALDAIVAQFLAENKHRLVLHESPPVKIDPPVKRNPRVKIVAQFLAENKHRLVLHESPPVKIGPPVKRNPPAKSNPPVKSNSPVKSNPWFEFLGSTKSKPPPPVNTDIKMLLLGSDGTHEKSSKCRK